MVRLEGAKGKGSMAQDGDRVPSRRFPSGVRNLWEKRVSVFPGAAWVFPCVIWLSRESDDVGVSSPLTHGGVET